MKLQPWKYYLLSSRTPAEKFPQAKKLQAIIIISAIVMFLLNIIRIYDFLVDPHNQGLPIYITLTIFIFFIILWWLVKIGKPIISAWLLILTYALPTIFCFAYWGADLPAAILMAVLIVMIAGILLGSPSALTIAGIFIMAMLIFTYGQEQKLISLNNNWREQPHQMADAISYALIFSIIFFLAWLIIKENRQALAKATAAGIALEEERQQLEIKVEKRTKEIQIMQKEKLEQLQALASIGQLSGSIFHDIINPLTVVNLNLEQIKSEQCPGAQTSKNYINQALAATNRINDLINSVNSCLRRQSLNTYFSATKEIHKIIQIMKPKAQKNNINIQFADNEKINLKGSSVRFGQIIMNLLANSIDACASSLAANKKINLEIKSISLTHIQIKIPDNGIGINPENFNKIFTPFFSTKIESEKNIGLGLSTVKEIIEQDFKGTIHVESIIGQGATFVISLPHDL